MHEELLAVCAYKEEKDLTSEEREVWRNERTVCHEHFTHFLKWVRIIVPPTPGSKEDSIRPLEMWPHIRKVVATLLTKTLISVLKARQIGLSTIIAAYVVWYALAKTGAVILLYSQGQNESKELLRKCRTIYEQLPPFMRTKLDPDSTEAIGFESRKSLIQALPSSISSGVGYTASVIVWDEHVKHEYADENYMHAKPVIDRSGAQAISIFTADPYTNDNLGTSLFKDAIDGKNGYTPLFFPWDVVPGRDEEWYEKVKINIPERELAKLSPSLYMSKNYPFSIEEALSLAENTVVFDKQVLNAMSEDARTYLEVVDGIDTSICHIYKPYHIGERYIAASDVSLGVGQDYTVTGIMNSDRQIVADIMSKNLDPEELAFHSVALLKLYHNPRWWPEQNGWGRTVIKKAIELGYRNIGYRGKTPIVWHNISNEDLKRVGFLTQDQSRQDLFGALIPAINDYQVRIYNQEGLKQFYPIIRNANKGGKIEASSGSHDDYVIMVGICILKFSDIQPMVNMEPIRTLDFKKQKRPDVIEALLRS